MAVVLTVRIVVVVIVRIHEALVTRRADIEIRYAK